jgi:hypothetical protein
VSVTIPSQGGNALALLKTKGIQRIGHLTRSVGNVSPCVAMKITLHTLRHNLAITMVPIGKLNQRRNQQ